MSPLYKWITVVVALIVTGTLAMLLIDLPEDRLMSERSVRLKTDPPEPEQQQQQQQLQPVKEPLVVHKEDQDMKVKRERMNSVRRKEPPAQNEQQPSSVRGSNKALHENSSKKENSMNMNMKMSMKSTKMSNKRLEIIPRKDALPQKNKEELLDETIDAKIKNDPNNRTILMVVAHADDEALWGGEFLLQHGPQTHVVVTSTNSRLRPVRMQEFRNVEEYFGYRGEYLNGDERMHNAYPLEDVIKQRIQDLVCGQEWAMIVTHGPEGEYGHIQHHNVHGAVVDAVQYCCQNAHKLHVFQPTPGPDKEAANFSERKAEGLRLYKSQKRVIFNFFGDWRELIVPYSQYNYVAAHEACSHYCRVDGILNHTDPVGKAKEQHILYPFDHDWEFKGQSGFC